MRTKAPVVVMALATMIAMASPAPADWAWNAFVDGDPMFSVSDPNYAYWDDGSPAGFDIEHDSFEALEVAAWQSSVGSYDGAFDVRVEFENINTGMALGIYLAEPGFDYLDPNAGDVDYAMTLFGSTLLRGNTLGWGSKADAEEHYQETYNGHPADGGRYAAQFGRTADAMLYAEFYQYVDERNWTLLQHEEWMAANPGDALTDLYLVSEVLGRGDGRFTDASYSFTKVVVTPEPTSALLLAWGALGLIRRR